MIREILRPSDSAAAAIACAYRPPRAPPGALRLDCTEGTLQTATIRRASREIKADAWLRYPDAAELEGLLASRWGVNPESVLVTAGADEALDRACRTYLAPGREALVTRPTFEMIPHWARLAGATLVEVPWRRGRLPLSGLLRAAGERTGAVFVVTPNNPTGAVARADDIRRLAADLPRALVVVDAAYGEFAIEDPSGQILGLPNVVVIRSLSKAWSLAGLRVGYMLGPTELISRLRATGGPYSVSRPSLLLARKRLSQDSAGVARHVSRVRQERSKLLQLLSELGAEPLESQANFVLCRFGRARFVGRALAALGIQVRSFPGRRELRGWLRITCPGRGRHFARLCRALQSTLRPQALLFDMDGVLADVSASYHRAVIETARTFGVEFSPPQVRRAKQEPRSNNDWRVTQRLLAQAGKQVALGVVTSRFEEIYHGRGGRPGLWRSERAIFPRDLLQRLGRLLPLGLVTGRPRRDALRFLKKERLRDVFSAVVCLEDAPAKPSPSPVRLALERLGVRRAWLVGDTTDDVAAARAAGVVPLGFCGSRGEGRGALLQAGAAEVMAAPQAIENLVRVMFMGGRS